MKTHGRMAKATAPHLARQTGHVVLMHTGAPMRARVLPVHARGLAVRERNRIEHAYMYANGYHLCTYG